MKSIRWMAAVGLVLSANVAASIAAEPLTTAGEVDAVTVYRGQALVTRIVEVSAPAGLTEVIVTDLPDQVDPGSIYAESANGIEVRSTRYRLRPVSADIRDEVKAIDDAMRIAQDSLNTNEAYLSQILMNRAYLDKLEQFVAPTATTELTRGVLNAETLEKLTTFVFAKRQTLIEEELKLNLEQRDLREKIELLQRQRNEMAGSSARTAREAVVFVNLKNDGGGKLRLRYLVNNATWAPSYNVRADADRTHALLQYNASIQQRSGEDWNNVAMTLSTATPSLIARAPTLSPLKISLQPVNASQQPQSASPKAQEGQLREQMFKLDNSRGMNDAKALSPSNQETFQKLLYSNQGDFLANGDVMGNVVFDSEINYVAGQLQNLEIANAFSAVHKDPSASAVQGVCVTYELASRTTLPSRSDQQLIQVASKEMSAEFYKVAIPVLTPHVYDEAAVINDGNQVLLAGPVSAYVDGEFVGHGDIQTISAGEMFTVGFGIDSSLRASRELIKRTEKSQGGNRIVDFGYRLTIANFGDTPASVRLLDRLPNASNNQVKLTLDGTGEDLSDDALYLKTDRKEGILRWEVEVPAGATGVEAWSMDYNFTLEYDRQMTIAGAAVTQR